MRRGPRFLQGSHILSHLRLFGSPHVVSTKVSSGERPLLVSESTLTAQLGISKNGSANVLLRGPASFCILKKMDVASATFGEDEKGQRKSPTKTSWGTGECVRTGGATSQETHHMRRAKQETEDMASLEESQSSHVSQFLAPSHVSLPRPLVVRLARGGLGCGAG